MQGPGFSPSTTQTHQKKKEKEEEEVNYKTPHISHGDAKILFTYMSSVCKGFLELLDSYLLSQLLFETLKQIN